MSALRFEAPGKLFVLGEWSILWGAPAVLVAPPGVAMEGALRAAPAEQPELVYQSQGLSSRWLWEQGSGWRCVEGRADPLRLLPLALASAGRPRQSGVLNVRSRGLRIRRGKRWVKLGFGSSAAATAVLVQAAAALAGERLRPAPLLDRALRVHREAQGGRGSGADVAVAVMGGPVSCLPSGAGLSVGPLGWPAGLAMLAVWTGQPADSRVLMAGVRGFEARDGAGFERHADAVAAAARAGLRAWRSGSARAVCEAAAAAGAALAALGRASAVEIEIEAHRALASRAERLLGARAVVKPSGAGGGDLALVFSDDPAGLGRLQAELTEAGHWVRRLEPGAGPS